MSQESRKNWLIIPSEDRAIVFHVVGDAVTSFSVQSDDETSLAKAIAKVFLEQEYNAEPVLLAPCSHDVLAVSLPADSSANRQAMIYELEEYVPIPAEQFIADFLQHEHGRFAGLIDHQKFLPLLDELATDQILVQHIVPLSILVAQYLISPSKNSENGIRSLIWIFDDEFFGNRIEFFLFTPNGLPFSWQLIDKTPDALRRALIAEIQARNADIYVDSIGLPDELHHVFETIPRVQLTDNIKTEIETELETKNILQQSIVRQSTVILARKQKAWWDFSRDQLAMRGTDRILGKSIRTLLWGTVAFLSALCLVFFVRGFQYNRFETQFRQEQEKVFREALPEQKIQTGFRNRLESEYKKMSAQRENSAELPQRESVLIPLLKVLQSLPPKVRYRFPEIRIEQNDIRLDGQLQVHGDAEIIATALENGGFAVEPPSTQQTGSNGVSVRLTIVRQNTEAKP
jgi:type II secretory pathway component PulL